MNLNLNLNSNLNLNPNATEPVADEFSDSDFLRKKAESFDSDFSEKEDNTQLSKEATQLKYIFRKVNKLFDFRNRQISDASKKLIQELGKEPAFAKAEEIVANLHKPYCPRITTPYQMLNKLADYELWQKDRGNFKPKKVNTIDEDKFNKIMSS